MNEIPREALIDMLKEACWYSGGRFKENGIADGFSLSVDEETCYRDVLCRGAKLHPTQEAAIIAHWKEYYQSPG